MPLSTNNTATAPSASVRCETLEERVAMVSPTTVTSAGWVPVPVPELTVVGAPQRGLPRTLTHSDHIITRAPCPPTPHPTPASVSGAATVHLPEATPRQNNTCAHPAFPHPPFAAPIPLCPIAPPPSSALANLMQTRFNSVPNKAENELASGPCFRDKFMALWRSMPNPLNLTSPHRPDANAAVASSWSIRKADYDVVLSAVGSTADINRSCGVSQAVPSQATCPSSIHNLHVLTGSLAVEAFAAAAHARPPGPASARAHSAALLPAAVPGPRPVSPRAAAAAAALRAVRDITAGGRVEAGPGRLLVQTLSRLLDVHTVEVGPALCALENALLRQSVDGTVIDIATPNLALLARRGSPERLAELPWVLRTAAGEGRLGIDAWFTAAVRARTSGVVEYRAQAVKAPAWATSTVALSLRVLEDGVELDLNLTSHPLSVWFTVNGPPPAGGFLCQHRDECGGSDWAQDGVQVGVHRRLPNGQWLLECRVSHLTQFAVTSVVKITQVSGCTDFYPSTAECPTAGLQPLTIAGANFGTAGARVYFGAAQDVPCLDVAHAAGQEDSLLYCRQYPSPFGAGYDTLPGASARSLPVTVVASTGQNWTEPQVTIAFAKRPVVTGISGCNQTVSTTQTAQCPTAGTRPVTVVGANFLGFGLPTLTFGPFPCQCGALTVLNGTALVCSSYPGEGEGLPVTVTLGTETSGATTVYLSYRPKPTVTSISGCDQPAGAGFNITGCNPHGNSSFLLQGAGFGGPTAAVIVTIGGQPCQAFSRTPSTFLCTAFSGQGTRQRVVLSVDGETANQTVLIDFASACVVSGGSVCGGHGVCNEAAGACVCLGSPLSGYWASPGCTDCAPGYYGAGCVAQCPGGASNPCSGHGTCDAGQAGLGVCHCAATYGAQDCSVGCPVTSEGVCAGHGNCSSGAGGTGLCTCLSGAAIGYWTGSACDQCQSSYYGPSCTGTCLGFPANICYNRGVCRSGRTGDGSCNCTAGFAGLDCSIYCPGSGVCSGHGTCDALLGTCTCFMSPAGGYWSGAACDSCLDGWSGSGTCILPCPRNGTGGVCSGRGACREGACYCDGGACGPSCNQTANCTPDCSAGLWGANCTNACPGNKTCSGHGTCSAGRAGTGLCTCQQGYAGLACNVACPGTPTPCNYPTGGSCNSTTGLCDCASGYAGSSCSVACAGGAGTPCNGHGTCSQGRGGSGACTCQAGYWGPTCLACPGVTELMGTCYGHGTCTATGGCVCVDNATGHWGGSDNVTCSQCRPGWFGSDCLRQCPRDASGVACSGHGACAADSEVCQCSQSQTAGYWTGTLCDQCLAGYWGPGCQGQCAGGACTPCSLHGTCSGGRNGTGSCTCYSSTALGFWSAADCAQCQAGYWGGTCTWECPGGHAAPCTGHGACSAGPYGTGACACAATPGKWDGTACDSCLAGYAGPNCTVACPGVGSAAGVCAGHGVCSAGRAGTGLCACAAGYYGTGCAAQCPMGSAGLVCAGHGACSDGTSGTGACTCYSDATRGYWTGSGCDQCQAGYFGAACLGLCPGAPANVCGGRGTCFSGVDQNGTCTCTDGWAGAGCTIACPGVSIGLVCNLRGRCNSVTGACECFNNTAQGFWAGANCTACRADYSGQGCTLPCPLGNLSAVCNGHGTCLEGRCVCTGSYCGTACEKSPIACGAYISCPGYYGALCDKPCPGFVPPNVSCSGHGQCDDGNLGSGNCTCYTGYAGAACGVQCPGLLSVLGTTVACSGRGVCSPTTGLCACLATYGLPDCSAQCPTAASGALCGGHGVCADGVAGDGQCHCTGGYAGAACDSVCPGGLTNPCSGHGACNTTTASCHCAANATAGYWGGADCSACAAGYHGAACLSACVFGVTTGQTCVCDPGWAGPDCSVACAGGVASPCSGHGTCLQGSGGNGSCVCAAGYRGANCTLVCPGGAANPCNLHGVCLSDATCQCYDDATNGYFTGSACAACAAEWFGPICLLTCPKDALGRNCSGHGACAAGSTVCVCAADAAAGFWDGTLCDACASGYYGATCLDECPGGACRPCNSHGVCDDGVAGGGRCTCYTNYSGVSCDGCYPGMWGTTCQNDCPGGRSTPCSGHGICSDGPSGSGLCTCNTSAATGYWGNASCATCASGWYGALCGQRCPQSAEGVTCSGRGTCSDGVAGSGLCTCAAGFAGTNCSVACPAYGGVVCSGFACDDGRLGSGVCACPRTAAAGYWDGAACNSCLSGYYGTGCLLACPTSGGVVCAGHGTCFDGLKGNGSCVCAVGYGGAACAVACPGYAAGVLCGGHGTCRAQDGSCLCVTDPTNGYWAGPNCDSCAALYSGPSCTLLCPSTGGVACSGHGNCSNGACACATGYCGGYCNITDCSGTCIAGHWGADCSGVCQGGAATPCSGHGVCRSGIYGDGSCLCTAGWGLADCSAACPTGPNATTQLVCSGAGLCDPLTATCSCNAGWGGAACQAACPHGQSGLLCSGPTRGTCSATGTCACALPGYSGLACEFDCPSDLVNPCSGHGACDQSLGRCLCLPAWNGTACQYCAAHLQGPNCSLPCVNGVPNTALGCTCNAGYFGSACDTECPGGHAAPCYGHGTCSDGQMGTGVCTCDAYWLPGTNCAVACSGGASNPCNSHGVCNLTDGSCSCDFSSALGYFVGTACERCAPEFFPPGVCRFQCPKDASGQNCSGHGSCHTDEDICTCYGSSQVGYWDGDLCAECQPGYWGPGCTSECPGGACNPCYSQGNCSAGRNGTGACTCKSSAADGFFAGPACSDCAPGYYGTLCLQECPGGATQPCYGQGTCDDGVTGTGQCTCSANATAGYWDPGTGCSDCLPAYYGAGCTQPCPGLVGGAAAAVPCSGNGTCSSGVAGNGTCVCSGRWYGPACAMECPAAKFDPATRACVIVCVHGTATPSGSCLCDAGWAGAQCNQTCPGFAAGLVCGGHGTCQPDATCQCSAGWAGLDPGTGRGGCTALCPGTDAAAPSSGNCSRHGVCMPNATCSCYQDAARGYYTGAACDRCAGDYFGAQCTLRCALGSNGKACSGNGACPSQSTSCVCYSDNQTGYWTGSLCDHCASGYYGPLCRLRCPGDGCVCSGRGTCFDGPTGNGTCRCQYDASGYNVGADCSQCRGGYYSLTCAQPCPGLLASGTPCYGHGVCADGRYGSGTCVCNQTAATGYWGPTACQDCLSGYYGPSCQSVCPPVGQPGNPCSGGGTCSAGRAGSGACTCDAAHAGPDCSLRCPNASGVVCNGRGACSSGTTGTGLCTCYNDSLRGYWTGAACTACVAGRWGPNCTGACPAAAGAVCAGHGACQDGRNGTGRCVCATGWVGAACAVECAGGAANPCNGHGTCHNVTGNCTCYRGPSTGFWAGDTCSTCDPLYSTPDSCSNSSCLCTAACPVNASYPGVACSGHGTCSGGRCSQCDQNTTTGVYWCGTACELTGAVCLQLLCLKRGYYGADCDQLCPGSTLGPGNVLNVTCSGHGVCDDGRDGSGTCACAAGWTLANCSAQCPGGAGNACTGNGVCLSTGTCVCATGWAGDACAIQCAGGSTNPCSGHGSCVASGATAGSCVCTLGYAGANCSAVCPAGSGGLCSLHGTCVLTPAGLAVCSCYASGDLGFWMGTLCDACVSPYHGTVCNDTCYNGVVTGTTCRCNYGYAGYDCSTVCPGFDGAATVCSGHGQCDWGANGTGTCTCSANWYGTNCSTFCNPSNCTANLGLVHAQCDSAGNCQCQNDAQGHWAGTYCSECASNFWGTTCSSGCICISGQSTCDMFTGTCTCYDDDVHGHFSGQACDECATDYLVPDCLQRNVQLAEFRPTPLQVNAGTFLTIPGLPDNSHYSTAMAGVQVYGSRVLLAAQPSVALQYVTGGSSAVVPSLGGVTISAFQAGSDTYVLARSGLLYTVATPTLAGCPACAFSAADLGALLTTSGHWRAFDVLEVEAEQPQSEGVVVVGDPADAGGWTALPYRPWAPAKRTANHTAAAPPRARPMRLASTAAADGACGPTACDASAAWLYCAYSCDAQRAVQAFTRASPLTALGVALDLSAWFDVLNQLVVVPSSPTPRLALGGSYGGVWRLLLLPLGGDGTLGAPAAGAVLGSVSADSPCSTNLCSCLDYNGYNYCTTVDRLTASASAVYLALAGYQYTYLVKVDPVQGTLLASTSILTAFTPPSEVLSITSLALDAEEWGMGFVCISRNVTTKMSSSTATTLYKWDLDDLQVTGTTKLQVVTVSSPSGEVTRAPEVVQAMYVNATTRTLYANVFMGYALKGMIFNLYAVVTVVPDYADASGGTVITVTGVGMPPSTAVLCQFGSDTPAGGTFLQRNVLHCTAPPSPTGGSESCTGQALEVDLFGLGRFTDNQVTVKRIPTPTITSAIPNSHYRTGGVVTLVGHSFVDTSYLRCRFFTSPDLGLNDAQETTAVTFINSTMVTCVQPVFPAATEIPAYVELSLDGQIFSDSKVQYNVIGDAAGLQVEQSDANWTMQSAGYLHLTTLTVIVVDSAKGYPQGHALGYLDNVTRSVTVSVAFVQTTTSSTTVQAVMTGTTTETMYNGTVDFADLWLVAPTVGTYRLTFATYDTTLSRRSVPWTTTQDIVIEAGTAVRLILAQQPRPVLLDNRNPFSSQPIVVLVDAANNTVTSDLALKVGVEFLGYAYGYPCATNWWVTAALYPCYASTSVGNGNQVALLDGFFTFENLKLVGLHNMTYRLRFYLVNTTGSPRGIGDVFSDWIDVADCDTRLALKFDTDCVACPDHATCDGSITALAQDNYWRANNITQTFYECTQSKACMGMTEIGTCKPGHVEHSVVCTECIDGYALNGLYGQCLDCGSLAKNLLMLVFLILALILGLSLIIWMNLRSDVNELAPCVLKLLLNHLQYIGIISTFQFKKPAALEALFSIHTVFSTTGANLAVLECLLYDSKAFRRFIINMMLPVLVIVICPLIFGLRALLLRFFAPRAQRRAAKQQLVDRYLASWTGVRLHIKGVKAMPPSLYRSHTRLMFRLHTDAQVVQTAVHSHTAAGTAMEWDADAEHALRVPELGTPEMAIEFVLCDVTDMQDSQPIAFAQGTLHLTRRTVTKLLVDGTLSAAVPLLKNGLRAHEAGVVAVQLQGEFLGLDGTNPATESVATGLTPAKLNGREAPRLYREQRARPLSPTSSDTPPGPKTPPPPAANAADARSTDGDRMWEVWEAFEGEEEMWDVFSEHEGPRSLKGVEITLMCCFVLLYFFYPTLITHIALLFQCDDFDWGLGEVRSYLRVDYTIDCNSSEHTHQEMIALVFAGLYGAGIPFGALLCIWLTMRLAGVERANVVFVFLLRCLRPDRWYWESLIMVRKFGLVLVSVFIRDGFLQSFVGLWILVTAMLLHWAMTPYANDVVERLETLSLCTLTASLALLAFFLWGLPVWASVLVCIGVVVAVSVPVHFFLVRLAQQYLLKVVTFAMDTSTDGVGSWVLMPVRAWLRKTFLRFIDNERIKAEVLDGLQQEVDAQPDLDKYATGRHLQILMLDPDRFDTDDMAPMLRVIEAVHAVVGRSLVGFDLKSGAEAWIEFAEAIECEDFHLDHKTVTINGRCFMLVDHSQRVDPHRDPGQLDTWGSPSEGSSGPPTPRSHTSGASGPPPAALPPAPGTRRRLPSLTLADPRFPGFLPQDSVFFDPVVKPSWDDWLAADPAPRPRWSPAIGRNGPPSPSESPPPPPRYPRAGPTTSPEQAREEPAAQLGIALRDTSGAAMPSRQFSSLLESLAQAWATSQPGSPKPLPRQRSESPHFGAPRWGDVQPADLPGGPRLPRRARILSTTQAIPDPPPGLGQSPVLGSPTERTVAAEDPDGGGSSTRHSADSVDTTPGQDLPSIVPPLLPDDASADSSGPDPPPPPRTPDPDDGPPALPGSPSSPSRHP